MSEPSLLSGRVSPTASDNHVAGATIVKESIGADQQRLQDAILCEGTG